MNNLAHKPRIDGLRGLAIASVLVFHFAAWIGGPLSAGSYGVNLFFVLSGFLITTILIRDGDGSFKKRYINFLGRRILRIFPIYYLTIFLLYIFKAPHINERLGYLLTYTYNFYVPKIDWIKEYVGHFWSLCVEEQFYVFFPLIAIALHKRLKALLIICLLLIFTAYLQVFFNIFNVQKFYDKLGVFDYKNLVGIFNYTSLLTNMAPLCIGAVSAIIAKRTGVPGFILSKKIEISVFLCIVIANCLLKWNYQILICSLCNSYLVVKAYYYKFSTPVFEKLVNSKYAIYFGKISYGLYIYHAILNIYLSVYIFDPLWIRIPFSRWPLFSKLQFHAWIYKLPLYTLISVSIAHFSFFYIEKPLLKLKDLYFKRP